MRSWRMPVSCWPCGHLDELMHLPCATEDTSSARQSAHLLQLLVGAGESGLQFPQLGSCLCNGVLPDTPQLCVLAFQQGCRPCLHKLGAQVTSCSSVPAADEDPVVLLCA